MPDSVFVRARVYDVDDDGSLYVKDAEYDEYEDGTRYPRVPYQTVMVFRGHELSKERIEVQVKCYYDELLGYLDVILDRIVERWPEAADAVKRYRGNPGRGGKGKVQAETGDEVTNDTRSGPTLRTRERALMYKKIKDANPSWSLERVAIEANRLKNTDEHTGEKVRSAYRAMEWMWERADRVR